MFRFLHVAGPIGGFSYPCSVTRRSGDMSAYTVFHFIFRNAPLLWKIKSYSSSPFCTCLFGKGPVFFVCWQHLRQNGIVRVSPVPPHLHVRCVCSPGNGVSDIGGTVRDELAWMLLTVARRVGALCWRGGGDRIHRKKGKILCQR